MTRKLILMAALGSALLPTAILAEEFSVGTSFARTEENPVPLATKTLATSLAQFDEQQDWAFAPPILPPEIEARAESFQPGSSHRHDAAEHLGNWLVVAGFGLSFTVGLIITISMTRPTTTQPKLVF